MEENLVPWPIDLQHLEPMGNFQTTLRGTWQPYCNCRWVQFGLPFLFGALQTGKTLNNEGPSFAASWDLQLSLRASVICWNVTDLTRWDCLPFMWATNPPHNSVYYWGRSFLHWLRPARNCSWTGRKSVSIGNVWIPHIPVLWWMATLLAFTATTLNTPKQVRNWLG